MSDRSPLEVHVRAFGSSRVDVETYPAGTTRDDLITVARTLVQNGESPEVRVIDSTTNALVWISVLGNADVMERKMIMRAMWGGVLFLFLVLAFGMPVNGTSNGAEWLVGRLIGTWSIETTPRYKGHSPAGMHAVCVNSYSDEVRIVPITERQAYGEPGTGAGALEAGAPCPPRR